MKSTLQSLNKKSKSELAKYTRLFFVLLIGALVLEILLGFPIRLDLKLDEDEPRPVQDLTKMTGAEQKMSGVHLVESRAGNRDWELYAEAADGYSAKGTWELKNVKVLFYSEDRVQFTVTGKAGTIDSKTKDMNISGDVLTLSANGYRFQAPQVNYLAKSRLLKSEASIKMTGPPDGGGQSMVLTGDKMETQVDQSLITINENVHAVKLLENGRKFSINSNGAEFSGTSYAARFFDKVSIELDSMKIDGPEARFQYNKDQDFLKSIVVQGGVKMTDVDKYATSEQVKFEPLENKFVLTGRPRVVQNNDEIQGDQIIFIDGGKKVKVENIRARMDKE